MRNTLYEVGIVCKQSSAGPGRKLFNTHTHTRLPRTTNGNVWLRHTLFIILLLLPYENLGISIQKMELTTRMSLLMGGTLEQQIVRHSKHESAKYRKYWGLDKGIFLQNYNIDTTIIPFRKEKRTKINNQKPGNIVILNTYNTVPK